MTEQTVKEIIKSFAYGLSAKEISDNEGTSLETMEKFAEEHASAVDMEMISHHRTISSGFVTFQNVKDLEFR